MTLPLRKTDDPEELTTADLARSANRTDQSSETEFQDEAESTPKMPVRSDRSVTDISERSAKASAPADATPLFPEDQLRDLQSKWNNIQTGFVDEPRTAVQDADALVASTMQQLAEAFSRERTNLEQQWGRGDSVSTEDLRVAFQRYRSFFRRMLSL
jgi:hypothetical protein